MNDTLTAKVVGYKSMSQNSQSSNNACNLESASAKECGMLILDVLHRLEPFLKERSIDVKNKHALTNNLLNRNCKYAEDINHKLQQLSSLSWYLRRLQVVNQTLVEMSESAKGKEKISEEEIQTVEFEFSLLIRLWSALPQSNSVDLPDLQEMTLQEVVDALEQNESVNNKDQSTESFDRSNGDISVNSSVNDVNKDAASSIDQKDQNTIDKSVSNSKKSHSECRNTIADTIMPFEELSASELQELSEYIASKDNLFNTLNWHGHLLYTLFLLPFRGKLYSHTCDQPLPLVRLASTTNDKVILSNVHSILY